MPSPSPLPLVDRIVPDGIEKYLRDARGKGLSYQRIATRLEAEHGVAISAQTISNWCADYGIAKP